MGGYVGRIAAPAVTPVQSALEISVETSKRCLMGARAVDEESDLAATDSLARRAGKVR